MTLANKKFSLPLQMFLGLALGVVFGLLAPAACRDRAFISTLFG
ncbi:dicarboxylate/amino acid:cation symporter, partial [Burkholderia pseudomallei]